jgi:hypothetical protein
MSAIYGQKLHVASTDRKNKSPFCAGPAGGRPQRAAEPGRVRRGVRALLGYGDPPTPLLLAPHLVRKCCRFEGYVDKRECR